MKKKPHLLVGHIRLLGLAALMTTGLTLQAQTRLTSGHTDIGIDYDSGFHLSVGFTAVEGGPEVDYEPDQAVLVALPPARTTVPSNPNFSFLGSPGSDIWILPQVQNTNLLFLGFGAEGIAPGTLRSNQLTMTLKKVAGPGLFAVYLTDGFGTPTKWFSSADAPGTDVQTIATGQHTHVNWAFSAPGDYTVTFQADALLPDGTPTSSGPVDYSFHVTGTPSTFLTKGHTDIGIDYDDGFQLSIGSTAVEGGPEVDYEPDQAVLVGLAASHTTVPNDPKFSFLGSPGSDIWILPQVQNTNLLFLGFGAEGIAPGTLRSNQLTMTLEKASGPGLFAAYLTDGFGTPTKWFSSADAPGTDVQTIATGQHTHINWAFSAPGDYTVTFQADALLPDSTPTSSGPVDYSFHVIGVPTTYLTKGHTDIDIGYDDATFELGISHGEPEQDFDVNNTVLVALAGAHTTVSANTNFSFLGSPGSDVWILPQVQDTNLLFLGFGAEDIDSGIFASNQLAMTLKYATGPGNFFVYLNDGFGTPTEWFSSEDAPGSDVRTISTGAHTHVNWAFSAPGDYTVVLQADAHLPDLTPVTTGIVYYSFHVVGTNENWINPTTPLLQVAAAGNTLDLSWPDHQGWILQSNSVSLTATNSWSPYPADGSTNVEAVTIGINPSKPNVFFRMVKP